MKKIKTSQSLPEFRALEGAGLPPGNARAGISKEACFPSTGDDEALFRKDYTQFQFLALVEVGFSDKAGDLKSCQFLNCKSSLF